MIRMTPASFLAGATALALIMGMAAVLLLLGTPYGDLPPGAQPKEVAGIPLSETDLIEEPDKLGSRAAMTAFFARQEQISQALAEALAAGSVPMTYALPDGTVETGALEVRSRALGDLPLSFWFQIAVGTIALMIGAWVLALRPRDPGAVAFALTGLALPISAVAAAVYSSRFIALDGPLFDRLSAINHFGAGAFGIALVALFAMYPRPLIRPVWLLPIIGVYGVLMLGDASRTFPAQFFHYMIMSQMLGAIGFGVAQWWSSRRNPLDRAGLRWFLLFSLVGCSLFIALSVAPTVLGLTEDELISQGYAFGFFLVMHVGLALGLLRYRVFELDRWAYLVWLWLGGAILVLAMDLALLTWLKDQPWVSLSAALLAAGFLYFPLRQLLLRRFFGARGPSIAGRVPEVVALALAPGPERRAALWDALLTRVFDPLTEITLTTGAPPAPGEQPPLARIEEKGLALQIPATADLAPRRLRYAARGRRLFGPEDAAVATTLAELTGIVFGSRRAFEEGITVERDRISRDVHDNIGAQILSALHTSEPGRKDDLLRDTLADLRDIINEGFRARYDLSEVLADLRAESFDRLAAHDIALDWPIDPAPQSPSEITLQMANTLRSVLREALSNAIRHSGATRVCVRVEQPARRIEVEIVDDGRGLPLEGPASPGNGLANIRYRIRALGGRIDIGPQATPAAPAPGTRIAFALDLQPF